MRIRRQPTAGLHLAPKILQLLFWNAAFKISARIDARRGVPLKINDVAVAGFSRRLKKMIKSDFVKRCRGREGRNVPANAFLNLVGADNHRHCIPPNQALDAAFHLLAAGERRLVARGNRVLIWGGG